MKNIEIEQQKPEDKDDNHDNPTSDNKTKKGIPLFFSAKANN